MTSAVTSSPTPCPDRPKRRDNRADESSTVVFESALTLTGFRQFHWLLLFVSGLVYISYGYENGISGYILPAAQCDLRMSSEEKGLLNAVYHIGGISSAFLWGVLADHVGRKRVIVWCLVIDAFITFASSFSQTFVVFATFRFLNGAVMMGPGSLICTYLGEFIGVKYRSLSVVILGGFYTVSWMVLPSAALAILPLEFRIELPGFLFNSWRLLIMVGFIPSLLGALILAVCFPESPKFLYSQGKEYQALEILERMFRFNYGKSKGPFPVKSILPTYGDGERRSVIEMTALEVEQLSKLQQVKPGRLAKLVAIIKGMGKQTLELFQPPYIGTTILTTSLMFCNAFGYYGLGLWLPEIFTRFETHYKESNVPVTMCELNTTYIPHNATTFDPIEAYCADTKVDPNVYLNTFIMGATCLFGNIVSTLLTNPLGLKFLTVITMGISAGSALATYFVRTSIENLIVSSIFLTFMEASAMSIISATCEMYPTHIRALAGCVGLLSNRVAGVISNFILGYYIDTVCEIPLFLMVGIVMLGTFLGFLLPGKYSKSTLDKIAA